MERTVENGKALVPALRELGFQLTDEEAVQVERGKDFVQLKNGPFDLDLIFALPDGIERFADAWARRVEARRGFRYATLMTLLRAKVAAFLRRQKDKESLPRLISFRDYWKQRHLGS